VGKNSKVNPKVVAPMTGKKSQRDVMDILLLV
jgi:hypothetical protein